MFIVIRVIVFSLSRSLSRGVDQTLIRRGVNCASARKDETFALQSADCSHLKKKKFKKKQKRIWRARAFARFSSSLVFFSVSFATTPRAKESRGGEAENRLKRKFSSLLNLLQI